MVVVSAEGRAAFELRDVRKRYGPGPPILDGVSLEIPEGKILVLLGTSGAGKTTALKMFNRLVDPDSGDVIVLAKNAREWDPIVLRRTTGYVIQEVGLFPHMTIADNVALVPRLLGWPRDRQTARVETLLTLLGLPSRFSSLYPRQLSGGERQRVGIARALAADPPLLLMDEPFGALDPLTRRRIQNEFRELQGSLGKTVILVTHDIPEAFRLGDVVVVMDAGRIIQKGTPDAIRARPEVSFVREFLEAGGR